MKKMKDSYLAKCYKSVKYTQRIVNRSTYTQFSKRVISLRWFSFDGIYYCINESTKSLVCIRVYYYS